ncbi:hypothetical protein L202_04806 [Cryptococcus amylolentus CBS 6039]|uniref:Uncharacterized protein n=2 Tax=Cryptococcus amylolentus TaxID=104669 RepID=A0A1E3HMT2_9TREE|nr:hypothetical protein L202_04806 [Cryptococcus amylolentus CBS 6039]ODN77653.1 hypothetical protein L202_04806 [Cryptococcus amylolentus CBS 6039]ODO05672.1 hypothetical protein I350_04732 [Cryptococcus amylolentus CBS 6273]
MPFTPRLQRDRSLSHSSSLSIARSPNVLSAANFGGPPISPHELDGPSFFEHRHAPRGSALGRTVSASGGDRLSAIQSVEDLTSAKPSTAEALIDPGAKTPSRLEAYTPDTYDTSEERLSAPLLKPQVHFDAPVSEAGEDETMDLNGVERLDGPAYEYTGPFQPPDSRELTLYMLSFGGVVILAVAAGLTTIFDWIL